MPMSGITKRKADKKRDAKIAPHVSPSRSSATKTAKRWRRCCRPVGNSASWPGSYGDVIVKGSIRYRFRFITAPGLMGFDADVRPEGAEWPVEVHGCATPEARAAVNPRVSDREAAACVSEAGLTASTAQASAQASGSRRGGVGPRTGSQAGRARASWGGFWRRRAKRAVAQDRSKAAPLCLRPRAAGKLVSGGARKARAPDHDALFAGAEWGAKGAGPILTAAYCSHSPARHPAHLGRFADVSIALSPGSLFLVVSRRIGSVDLTPPPDARPRE